MDRAEKKYQVTYKAYHNTRLKKVLFHGKAIHPLYVQVTFGRLPIIFKSYYFDLFSKPGYAARAGAAIAAPHINVIIDLEMRLVEFIIAKNTEAFSLELFKQGYAFYSRDIAATMEQGFIDFLFIFFSDKGMPSLAAAIRAGCTSRLPYDVLKDMGMALSKPFYNELIASSLSYGPPYLPVYGFITTIRVWPVLCLSVMEWQEEEIKEKFGAYLETYYPIADKNTTIRQVEGWIQQTP